MSLGDGEERIRRLLWERQAPAPSEYCATIGTSLNQRYPTLMSQPGRYIIDGLECFRLLFPGVYVDVKVDPRPPTATLERLILQPRITNYIICYPWRGRRIPSSSQVSLLAFGNGSAAKRSNTAR